jgi:VWFA-related protein
MRHFYFAVWATIVMASSASMAQIAHGSNAASSHRVDRSSLDTGPTRNNSNAGDESKVDFLSQSVLVQVPVVVLDKQGAHLPGLTKDFFEILENGKPREIATFEEFKAISQPLVSAAETPSTFSNTTGNSRVPRNTTVIVLDTVNTPFLDQAYGRKELIRYLARNLDSGQALALAVLTSKGVRIAQNITQDPAALLQSVNRLAGELSTMEETGIDAQAQAAESTPGSFSSTVDAPSPTLSSYITLRSFVLSGDAGLNRLQQDQAIEATMRGFLDISWALSGIPGRKSLIWATGSFPFYMNSPGAVPGGPLSALYERTMKALNDAQISVYPVDVRGLVNTNSAPAAYRGPANSVARNWLHNSSVETLRDFAEMTGGVAFYSTNDIADSFHRAIADSASYYLVSYYLDTANRNPGWRKLKVKVNRKGVEVRSRNGFFVTNTTVNPALTLKLDLEFAIHSPFDSTGVPLSVQWTDMPLSVAKDPSTSKSVIQTDKKKVGFLLRVSGNGVEIETGTPNRLNLDLLAYAFTGKGEETAGNFAKNFEVALGDTQLPKFREKGLGYQETLDLPPGKYTVRFVVRDNLSGRIGSVSAPVTVN